jgi:predicted transcriptional regulator
MALANELSSEIAAALLSTGENSPAERENLKRVVEEIHTTLERMEERERQARKVRKPLARTATGDY